MTDLSVRDVSEDALSVLRIRAAAKRQSLQAFVRDLIEREAHALSIEEAARKSERIAMRNNVTADDVLEAIEAARQGSRL
jgi:plasmid stability protein